MGREMDGAESLSIVVLSFNRREALAKTLGELEVWARAGAEVIVVDNASSDGSADMVAERFGWARLERLAENRAIAGFNAGARLATREFVLILDDDAWPEGEGLKAALALMKQDAALGGVMLHRVHPRTGEMEWPFDRVQGLQRGWPDMGCANLVRRSDWERVGGYEERYFLYRNDTDLALKLLGAGRDVAFNPQWPAMHDSPIVSRRTPRWFFLSTRNWVWMCRRHGRGLVKVRGIVLGWLWAHRLAGVSPARHWGALRGAAAGVFGAAPSTEEAVKVDGKALARLLKLKASLRKGGEASGALRRA